MSEKVQRAYETLIGLVRETTLLESCRGLLEWEEQTYMPLNGSAHRAEQIGLLAKLIHARATDPKIGELLAEVEGSELCSDPESDTAVNIREIRRAYDRRTKLPPRLVEEIARTTTLAGPIWREARENRDFEHFLPSLEQIVRLKQEEAQAVGYEGHIYDALLDEYEPGATTAEVTQLFSELREQLVPILKAIVGSGRRPRREILHRRYPIDRQEIFAQEAAAAIGFDFASGRLDVAVHPFCQGIGPGDCRITTRYNERFFNEAFFGILHESGHGMYEQNLPHEHYGTPLGEAISLGIHESQSRLWENQVGRSRVFWEHFFPRIRQVFPLNFMDVTLDDFYFAINDVRPSFIRVEADEVTYNLHIILRFELEQALVSGDLAPKDVPGAWDEKFRDLFDLTPENLAQGCLQDVHWSMGGIGYFPTYTLGNLYAAQFMAQAREEVSELDGHIRAGDFTPLRQWLTERIYQQGRRFWAGDLCERLTGSRLTTQPFITYLREKFGPLYGF